VTFVIVLAANVAHAEPGVVGDGSPAGVVGSSTDDLGDQGIGATAGVATGGRVTAGGIRVTGHYLYQLSSKDWFDGTAAFTLGSGDAACSRDRMNDFAFACDHGIADGSALEIAAGVRRMFAAQGAFRPFARAAVGISYTRFRDDDVSGVAFPLHLGGGVRAAVSEGVALVALADLNVGFGRFGKGLATEPQLGLAISAGAEFRLR
jgi:hypothetical protein